MKMKKNKGMLTIEAALVMPLVIYIVFIMISIFLLMYTKIYVTLSTNHAIALATGQWYSIGSDFDKSHLKSSSVIVEAIGAGISSQNKARELENKIKQKVENGAPMKVDLDVKAKPFNYLVGQNVKLEINAEYQLPVSGLFKLLGISEDGKFNQSYTRTVNLSNNEANMRTVSYASKLVKKASEKVNQIIKDMTDAIKGG